MILRRLRLTQYKNYAHLDAEFHNCINVITGQNGQGKTNLLDAIYQLSFGKSNFQYRDTHVVQDGQDFFRIDGSYDNKDQANDRLIIKFKKKGKKDIERNAKKHIKLADHIGEFPLVMIGPRDIYILFEGSKERRRLIDSSICQYDKTYLKDLLTYNRLLTQRNAMLKQNYAIDENLFESFDEQMGPLAHKIYQHRKSFVEHFSTFFIDCYQSIAKNQEQVTVTYRSQLEDHDFIVLQKENRQKDIILKRTSAGVHKDDLLFYLNKKPLKSFASEGQLKSAIFSIKLAQLDLLLDQTDKFPILLLDDIFAKLDRSRVENVLDYIMHKYESQIFISDTDPKRVSELIKQPHKVFLIDQNQCTLQYESKE